MSRPAVLFAVAAMLAGCDARPKSAEWQDVCVAAHTESSTYSTLMYCGKSCWMPVTQTISNEVCDRTARQCVAGKDGSTICAPEAR